MAPFWAFAWRSIGLGIPVVLFALFAFYGQDGLGFLVLSVVCTLGAALIGWGFLAFVVGAMILGLSKLFTTQYQMSSIDAPATPSDSYTHLAPSSIPPAQCQETMSFARRALIRYIDEAMRMGKSRDETIAKLKANGWLETEVKQMYEARKIAFGSACSSGGSSTPPAGA